MFPAKIRKVPSQGFVGKLHFTAVNTAVNSKGGLTQLDKTHITYLGLSFSSVYILGDLSLSTNVKVAASAVGV